MKHRFWAALVLSSFSVTSFCQADWPMLGGSPARNMANPNAKGIPQAWSIKKGAQKNILWSTELGTTTYGAVVGAGGKIFIGSNNERPKDPAITGDKGILYAFDAATGKFLTNKADA